MMGKGPERLRNCCCSSRERERGQRLYGMVYYHDIGVAGGYYDMYYDLKCLCSIIIMFFFIIIIKFVVIKFYVEFFCIVSYILLLKFIIFVSVGCSINNNDRRYIILTNNK